MRFSALDKAIVIAAIAVNFHSIVYAQGVTAASAPSQPPLPAWAYAWDPKFVPPPDSGLPTRVPNSNLSFTMAQERDLFFAPDWHPADHPPMPEVVARGRKPDVRACGSCHRAEGTGGPENAPLAGLPAAYIVQQMADFKSGARKSLSPNPGGLMTVAAKAATDAEVQAAAAYFASLKPKQNIKVVESETAPRTFIARIFYALQPGGGTEPLGRRIIEVPDSFEQFEHRDSRTLFTAYVPIGSIARGAVLAKSNSDGKVPCSVCHGADLKGLGPVPGIAGRSPSYMMRQMHDMKMGARAGTGAALMKDVVAKLSEDEMMALVAYLASLTP